MKRSILTTLFLFAASSASAATTTSLIYSSASTPQTFTVAPGPNDSTTNGENVGKLTSALSPAHFSTTGTINFTLSQFPDALETNTITALQNAIQVCQPGQVGELTLNFGPQGAITENTKQWLTMFYPLNPNEITVNSGNIDIVSVLPYVLNMSLASLSSSSSNVFTIDRAFISDFTQVPNTVNPAPITFSNCLIGPFIGGKMMVNTIYDTLSNTLNTGPVTLSWNLNTSGLLNLSNLSSNIAVVVNQSATAISFVKASNETDTTYTLTVPWTLISHVVDNPEIWFPVIEKTLKDNPSLCVGDLVKDEGFCFENATKFRNFIAANCKLNSLNRGNKLFSISQIKTTSEAKGYYTPAHKASQTKGACSVPLSWFPQLTQVFGANPELRKQVENSFPDSFILDTPHSLDFKDTLDLIKCFDNVRLGQSSDQKKIEVLNGTLKIYTEPSIAEKVIEHALSKPATEKVSLLFKIEPSTLKVSEKFRSQIGAAERQTLLGRSDL